MRKPMLAALGIVVVACSSGPEGSTTDVPPTQVPPTAKPGDCGLPQPAFCETFETPAPGGKAGDLDERIWAFNRWGHFTSTLFDRPTSIGSPKGLTYKTPVPFFCGAPFTSIDAPNDARDCDGPAIGGGTSKQFNEVLDDAGGFGLNEMRIRQPFDFTDRTGTIVFDLDAKKNDGFDGHGWWTEVWITEDPSPLPYHGAPTVGSYPRNGIGFQIIPVGCGFQDGQNEVGRIFVSRDYKVLRDDNQGGDECFKTKDGALNRFKLLISKDKAEFYATDAGKADGMRLVTTFTNLGLDFTRGYVHFQHAQYNANKADASPSQAYRWDNIGFDGPSYAPLRTYEVPDELEDIRIDGVVAGKSIGYKMDVPRSFTLQGVDVSNAARARFGFNIPGQAGKSFRYRFNKNAWHTFTIPGTFDSDQMRSFMDVVPVAELRAGANTIDVEGKDLEWYPYIGNMELVIEAKN